MLGIDRDLERVVEIEHHDGSTIGVENRVGFRVAGDQNSSASLGGWHACVSLRKLRCRHGKRDEEEEEENVMKMAKRKINLKVIAFGTVTVKLTKRTITVMKESSYRIAGKGERVAAFFYFFFILNFGKYVALFNWWHTGCSVSLFNRSITVLSSIIKKYSHNY